MSDEVKEDAAPSSTEPVQAISVELTPEQVAAQAAMAESLTNSQVPAEDPNVGASDAAESSPVESGSATPVSTDAGSSQPVASSPVESIKLTTEESANFESVMASPPQPNEALQQGLSSASLTFEQRVEQRFLQVEAFIVKLPYSIAHALHQGSGSVEELAERAIAHLFGKDQ
ncbi:hypothetical protein ACW910_24180 (plasmid) [Burkholderia ambifaria]